MPAPAFPVADG